MNTPINPPAEKSSIEDSSAARGNLRRQRRGAAQPSTTASAIGAMASPPPAHAPGAGGLVLDRGDVVRQIGIGRDEHAFTSASANRPSATRGLSVNGRRSQPQPAAPASAASRVELQRVGRRPRTGSRSRRGRQGGAPPNDQAKASKRRPRRGHHAGIQAEVQRPAGAAKVKRGDLCGQQAACSTSAAPAPKPTRPARNAPSSTGMLVGDGPAAPEAPTKGASDISAAPGTAQAQRRPAPGARGGCRAGSRSDRPARRTTPARQVHAPPATMEEIGHREATGSAPACATTSSTGRTGPEPISASQRPARASRGPAPRRWACGMGGNCADVASGRMRGRGRRRRAGQGRVPALAHGVMVWVAVSKSITRSAPALSVTVCRLTWPKPSARVVAHADGDAVLPAAQRQPMVHGSRAVLWTGLRVSLLMAQPGWPSTSSLSSTT